MKLEARHIRCIDLLVANRFAVDGEERTQAEIAKEVKVRPEQVSRWLNDEDFQGEYQERLDAWKRDLEAVPFSIRKHRLLERVRLYNSLPDEYEEVTEGTSRNGDPWRRVRVHSNQSRKAAILNDIEREMEGWEVDELGAVAGALRREILALKGKAALKVSK